MVGLIEGEVGLSLLSARKKNGWFLTGQDLTIMNHHEQENVPLKSSLYKTTSLRDYRRQSSEYG